MEKKGSYRNLLEMIFDHLIPYMTIFLYWGGDREAVETLLVHIYSFNSDFAKSPKLLM
jgi:hypothetical protein